MKKQQHLLNVLFIVLLDGRIIYISPTDIGSCDQSLWNSLELQKKYENQPFGILGDGGFTFNRKDEETPILSVKPVKHPCKSKENKNPRLSSEEKKKKSFHHTMLLWRTLLHK